ncbi:MAG: Stk1 family PASTA domain-containing Ser/Thr kinase [Lachnospiraceae bacterium]|nr:Stk1 family PASTA domain-containing Ser/Thr kinase [Lachnospiraceae bacterium]
MIKLGMMLGDRYEILDKIGTGGMSDVYKAKCHKLNRFVAVKVLKQEFSENANFVSKFRTEAQAAAGMMHPNIVNVYDVGEEGGMYYIVMELVEGITLKKYIEKKSRLTFKEAISIAIQVSMGIECAHNNHIIHRDIKPQNIMISKDGKVKVTDFGIAKAVSSNTITSNVMGSVHYTSPEQARGGYSDEKSDIYSLGVTIFEMLTGRVPFNGETTVAIAIKHIQEPMPSVREFVPEIPISVEQIVYKCTQKSPDRRYQNMAELIADLKRSLMNPNEDFVKIIGEVGETVVIPEKDIRKTMGESEERSSSVHMNLAGEKAVKASVPTEEERAAAMSTDQARRVRPAQIGDDRPGQQDNPNRKNPGSANRQASSGKKGKNGRKPNAAAGKNSNRPNGKPVSRNTGSMKNSKNTKPSTKPKNNVKTPEEEERTERIITIAAVASAVVIGLIIIYVVAKAFGIIGSGSEPETTSVEETLQSVSSESEESVEASEGEAIIPDVHGKLLAEAVAILNNEGFEVEKVEAPSDSVAKGNIVDQVPLAGTAAKRGSVVTISVSIGPSTSKVKVPAVVGLDIDEAMALIIENGLQVGAVTDTTNEDISLKDKVCYQSYAAGSNVASGTVIDLKISTGPEKVTYGYTGNVDSPSVEDGQYEVGSQATVILTTTTGIELKRETTTTFPVSIHISGITDCEDGIITILYTVTTPGSTYTNENGEVVDVPSSSEDRSITRTVKFTRE